MVPLSSLKLWSRGDAFCFRCQSEASPCALFSEIAIMGFANIWNAHPRKFGPGSRYCRVCKNTHGIIRKYGLNMCRRCFREYSDDIGFKKLD
ncbi:40S ribosomal protein S29-like [Mizuhopecten yessoensis]|uniref:40S ribosomal protein S29-like n=1 Tax=Mizuhopecten yessoensis TaxID=6573 RepID=UPI000B45D52E|nr:40S ribosomal protein S29-like [Mizuhopecten yessoensis]